MLANNTYSAYSDIWYAKYTICTKTNNVQINYD